MYGGGRFGIYSGVAVCNVEAVEDEALIAISVARHLLLGDDGRVALSVMTAAAVIITVAWHCEMASKYHDGIDVSLSIFGDRLYGEIEKYSTGGDIYLCIEMRHGGRLSVK